jgi:hypothetical protein
VSFIDVFKELEEDPIEEDPIEEDPVEEDNVFDKGRDCG